jgi:hypothetical protein
MYRSAAVSGITKNRFKTKKKSEGMYWSTAVVEITKKILKKNNKKKSKKCTGKEHCGSGHYAKDLCYINLCYVAEASAT